MQTEHAYLTEQFEAAGYDVLSIRLLDETTVVTTTRDSFRFEYAADDLHDDCFVSRSGRTVIIPDYQP